jgi:spermidine synthase
VSRALARALVFFASASVLVLEILAGRLMAPYVGISLETFTGIIGTVLAAIAVGSWAGGRAADRQNPADLIGPAFLVGGALGMLAPTIIAAIGPAMRGGGAAAIVIITAVAFFLPAAALSAVTPLIVKLQLQSLAQTGEVVGSFSAVGTAGALVGTFVTGFVLLATIPTRPVVLGLGVLLVVTGGLLTARRRELAIQGVAAAGLIGLLLVVVDGPCQWETAYSCAAVVVDPDNDSGRILRLDHLSHSYVDLDDPTYLDFRYIRDFVAAVEAQAPDGPLVTLGVGGGGFTMPRFFAATRPGSDNVVYEIDDALVDIGRSELGLDPDAFAPSTISIITEDARIALQRRLTETDDAPLFDVVIGDAFSGTAVPWHLTTVEFIDDLKAAMALGGTYVMNVIDYGDRDFIRAEVVTAREVFTNVAVLAPTAYFDAPDTGGNFVVVATDADLDRSAIEANLVERGSSSVMLDGAALDRWLGDPRILTDDFAPVDQLVDIPY